MQIRTPQFVQSLEAFNSALQSGQVEEMVQQFGFSLAGPAAPDKSAVEVFLEAVMKRVADEQKSSSNTEATMDES